MNKGIQNTGIERSPAMELEPHHVIKTWEYFTAIRTEDANLDEYGEEGWELVAVTVAAGTNMRNYYFKRPLVGDPRQENVI